MNDNNRISGEVSATKGFNFSKYLFAQSEIKTKVAIQYKDSEITIGELESFTHSFAAGVKKIGLKENSRTLLLLKDTPAFSFSFLGLMAIGVIPVPLSPKLSLDSLLYIASDSQCKTIILEPDSLMKFGSSLLKRCKKHGVKLIVQDVYSQGSKQLATDTFSMQSLVNEESDTFQYVYNDPQDISFWQYTSGTTGHPKGVQHNSSGMIENYRLFAKNTLKLSNNDTYYSVAKMFFGYGLGNSLVFPMLGGSTVVLDEEWPTLEKVVDNINHYKPSAFFCVPAIYAALINNLHLLDSSAIENIKIFFSAGSPLPASLYKRWHNMTGKFIFDGIGATEVGHVFLCNSPEVHRAGTTGKVVNGYQVKLIPTPQLTGKDKKCGVLYVKGPSVSQGYWNNTNKTANKFVDGWYHTGDLFEITHDGLYRYLGREDDLYKINGRWVEPNKIEAYVIKTIDYIQDALLVPYLNSEGLEKACLFVVGNTTHLNKNEIEENIIHQLSNCFSNFEIPHRVKVLSGLPRNDNGKVVRKSLSDLAAKDDVVLSHQVKPEKLINRPNYLTITLNDSMPGQLVS